MGEQAIKSLLGLAIVMALMSGLILVSLNTMKLLPFYSHFCCFQIAFVASWSPFNSYAYSNVECTVNGASLTACCAEGEDTPCALAVVAFNVSFGGNKTHALGFLAPYGSPVPFGDADRLRNETRFGQASRCYAPTVGEAARPSEVQQENATDCHSLPSVGQVVYVAAAEAASFERMLLGVWVGCLIVFLLSALASVILCVMAHRLAARPQLL